MTRGGWIGAAAVCALALVPQVARADAAPLPIPVKPGWNLPIGVTLGGAFRKDAPDGFFLGGEVSVAKYGLAKRPKLAKNMWLGALADVAWDFGIKAVRHRVGPEFGIGPVGLEFAYLGQAANDLYRPGLNMRLVVTVAIVALYGGYGHVFIDQTNFGEFGGLVKFPIPLE